MEEMKHCVRWVLAALLFFTGTASAQHCTKLYWFDDQRSYCLSCGEGQPPWGTGSYYAHQLRYYVFCQSCGIPCQISTNGGECAAVLSQGEHLSGALLYGIRSPATTAGFRDLTHAAPELALVLFDRGISSEGARSSDMRRLESRTRRLITPDFVDLVAAGVSIDEKDVQRLTKEVGEGFEVLVEATTEVSDQGRATLVLGSRLVRTGTQEVTAVMNQYLVHLEQAENQAVSVEGYPSLSAKVYDIVGIDKL